VVGERVALQLAGVPLGDLPRGEQLLSQGPWQATDRLAVSLTLLPGARSLDEGDEAWLHILAARTLARVERLTPRPLEPGTSGRAVVRLARRMFAVPGDRVVLRTPSPALTMGGGLVVDPWAARLPRRAVASLAAMADATRSRHDALLAWIAEAGPAGVEVSRLAGRLGVLEAGIEAVLGRLVEEGTVEAVPLRPPRLIHRTAINGVKEGARELLARVGATGVPIAELLSRVLPAGTERLRDHYLEAFRAAGILREVSGRALAFEAAAVEDPLGVSIETYYRRSGIEAPSPDEVAARLGANPKAVQGMVRFLLDRGRLARVGGKWILHRDLLDEIVAGVRGWGVDAFDVGQFKDRFSLTRKLAIPILEWLDSNRVTRREGDRRRVLPPRPS
jgi:selenocysteine-specific elongation factor